MLLAHDGDIHVDRYGFMVGTDDGSTNVATTSKPQPLQHRDHKKDQRRVQKWRKMLGNSRSDFQQYCQRKHRKVKRRIRKGIPDEFRGLVWQYLSGMKSMQQHCSSGYRFSIQGTASSTA